MKNGLSQAALFRWGRLMFPEIVAEAVGKDYAPFVFGGDLQIGDGEKQNYSDTLVAQLKTQEAGPPENVTESDQQDSGWPSQCLTSSAIVSERGGCNQSARANAGYMY
jgi:hypothetical protein